MIDCIFILLIFFIVTTVFVNEAGVKVNKPEVKGAQALDKNSILIAVTADNDVAYDGKIIGVQGVATVVKQALKDNKEMRKPVTALFKWCTVKRLSREPRRFRCPLRIAKTDGRLRTCSVVR